MRHKKRVVEYKNQVRIRSTGCVGVCVCVNEKMDKKTNESIESVKEINRIGRVSVYNLR